MPNPQTADGRDFSEKLVVTCQLAKEFLANSIPHIPPTLPSGSYPEPDKFSRLRHTLFCFLILFKFPPPIVVHISHFVTFLAVFGLEL